MHRLYLGEFAAGDSQSLAEGQRVQVEGDEAAHIIRVKRLAPGDPVELFDGRGLVARAVLADPEHYALGARASSAPSGWPTERRRRGGGRAVTLLVQEVRHVAPTRPRFEVWAAIPKGARVDEMIDQLSQVGASAWAPLKCARSVVEAREDGGGHKIERLRRIAIESAKQCARAWLLEIVPPPAPTFEQAIAPTNPGTLVLLAHGDGDRLGASPALIAAIRAAATVRLLIGPEGGWDPRELSAARAAAVPAVRFGPHIMRIETAAPVAVAMVIEHA